MNYMYMWLILLIDKCFECWLEVIKMLYDDNIYLFDCWFV